MIRPAHDFAFRGKWLIRYDPGEFTYPEILILLPPLQTRLERLAVNYKFLNITFNRNIRRSRFYLISDYLFISHNGSDWQLAETDPGAFAVQTALEPLRRPIHSVNLLFPRLESDPRWKTMGLPAGQLLLASGLKANGFEVTPLLLVLPTGNLPAGALFADMAGYSVFEDLLPVLRPFLARFRTVYDGWLAAGGPFPTLAPLAALYHLPQLNLFVRGEAELAFPEIIKALNLGKAEELFRQSGFAWQQPGLIVMSDFDRVNRPETFSRFQVNFNFLRPEHLEHGLEMNFSRGCKRGCVFCCRAQGSKFRELPLDKAVEILHKYGKKIAEFELNGGQVRTVNINDDDILQDSAYAAAVFALIKKHGFRIHGIQTSLASMIKNNEQVNYAIIDIAADPELYVNNRQLLWLGTDVFLKVRARRLGKVLPSPKKLFKLLGELERRHIHHYHYWISSDGDSTWEEFIEELTMIIKFYRDFPNFGLLAHAPFIVPYATSRLFQRLPVDAPNLKIKETLDAPDPIFRYVIAERLETPFLCLNSLLKNEKAGGDSGFFDFLKAKDFSAAAQLAYHFLKQEQLQRSTNESGDLARCLSKLEELIQGMVQM
jgi:hypothetical protein